MEAKNSHWRKVMKTRFLSGDELQEKGQVVTIESYDGTEFFSPKSKAQEEHVVLKFKEIGKPMILTNKKAKAISKVLDTPLMDEWIGGKVTIFPKSEKHFGEWFPVINIKAATEPKKQPLNSDSKNWKQACDALKEGKTTISAIKKHYKITEVVRLELEKLIPNKI